VSLHQLISIQRIIKCVISPIFITEFCIQNCGFSQYVIARKNQIIFSPIIYMQRTNKCVNPTHQHRNETTKCVMIPHHISARNLNLSSVPSNHCNVGSLVSLVCNRSMQGTTKYIFSPIISVHVRNKF